MPVSVTMPRLGESVTEGTVTRWLKQEGDTGRGRRAAARGLHRQGRHRDPVAGRRRAAPASSSREDETAEVGSELAVIAGDGESGGGAAPAQESRAGRSRRGAAQAEPSPPQAAGAEASPSRSRRAEPPRPPPAEPAPAPAAAARPRRSTMPALGESVTEGTVTRWLKEVGDTVEVDEPLLEVSTDKVDTEIPSPVAGTLLEIKVPEDETADVGAELAVIGAAGAAPAADRAAPTAAARGRAARSPAPAAEQARRSRRRPPRPRRSSRRRRPHRGQAPAREPAARAGRRRAGRARHRPPRPAATRATAT